MISAVVKLTLETSHVTISPDNNIAFITHNKKIRRRTKQTSTYSAKIINIIIKTTHHPSGCLSARQSHRRAKPGSPAQLQSYYQIQNGRHFVSKLNFQNVVITSSSKFKSNKWLMTDKCQTHPDGVNAGCDQSCSDTTSCVILCSGCEVGMSQVSVSDYQSINSMCGHVRCPEWGVGVGNTKYRIIEYQHSKQFRPQVTHVGLPSMSDYQVSD